MVDAGFIAESALTGVASVVTLALAVLQHVRYKRTPQKQRLDGPSLYDLRHSVVIWVSLAASFYAIISIDSKSVWDVLPMGFQWMLRDVAVPCVYTAAMYTLLVFGKTIFTLSSLSRSGGSSQTALVFESRHILIAAAVANSLILIAAIVRWALAKRVYGAIIYITFVAIEIGFGASGLYMTTRLSDILNQHSNSSASLSSSTTRNSHNSTGRGRTAQARRRISKLRIFLVILTFAASLYHAYFCYDALSDVDRDLEEDEEDPDDYRVFGVVGTVIQFIGFWFLLYAVWISGESTKTESTRKSSHSNTTANDRHKLTLQMTSAPPTGQKPLPPPVALEEETIPVSAQAPVVVVAVDSMGSGETSGAEDINDI